MGLFSFLKGAGQKLFGNDEAEKAAAAAADAAAAAELKEASRQNRIAVLTQTIQNSGVPVTDLSVDVQNDAITVYGTAKTTSDKEKIILMLGNTDGVATVDDRMSVEFDDTAADFYVVQEGDSLSKIAKEFYGDYMKYPAIFEANKPMLTHEDLIYPGQTLRIPKM
jgi:nucleoid-associated protein YgaU